MPTHPSASINNMQPPEAPRVGESSLFIHPFPSIDYFSLQLLIFLLLGFSFTSLQRDFIGTFMGA